MGSTLQYVYLLRCNRAQNLLRQLGWHYEGHWVVSDESKLYRPLVKVFESSIKGILLVGAVVIHCQECQNMLGRDRVSRSTKLFEIPSQQVA